MKHERELKSLIGTKLVEALAKMTREANIEWHAQLLGAADPMIRAVLIEREREIEIVEALAVTMTHMQTVR